MIRHIVFLVLIFIGTTMAHATDLKGRVSHLEDCLGIVTIEEVSNYDERYWKLEGRSVPSYGYTRCVQWLRLDLNGIVFDKDEAYFLRVGKPTLDFIDAYFIVDGSIVKDYHTGDNRPYNSKPIKGIGYTFPVEVEHGEKSKIFFRIKGGSTIEVPISLMKGSEWSDRRFDYLFHAGIWLGVALTILLAHTYFYLLSGDKTYFYYVMYVIGVIGALATGHGFMYRYFVTNVWLNDHLALIFAGIWFCFTNLFLLAFFTTEKMYPKLTRFFNWWAWATLVALGPLLFLPLSVAGIICTVSGLVLSVCCTTLGLWVGIKKRKPAVIPYGLAVLLVLVSVIMVVLVDNNVISGTVYFDMFFYRSLLAEFILLAYALSFRLEDSKIDELTKLKNRRGLDESLSRSYNIALRKKRSLAILMIDIDKFKPLNDTYGHQCGDYCLREVAQRLNGVLVRKSDMVARYGGEEFTGVFLDTDMEGSLSIAERMRRAIADKPFEYEGKSLDVTISVGVCVMVPEEGDDYGLYIQYADKAMYQAKHKGRNGVYWYNQEKEEIRPAVEYIVT